jgi:hypothetical protein
MTKNYYQREHHARNGKLQQGNYASINNQGDEQLFMMQHMVNLMIRGVSNNNVWYVDSGASNHMTSHGEWFRNTKDLKTLRFVETSDDTTHPITQIGKVPLPMQDGQTKYLKDVFHVLTITKFGLRKPNDGTRFTCDIQPKWMFYGRHEEPRQIDCKRGKEWTNVHLGCEHA